MKKQQIPTVVGFKKPELEVGAIFTYALIGSSGFGFWQNSFGAGVFMFVIFLVVISLVWEK